jgi:hypothetical protein
MYSSTFVQCKDNSLVPAFSHIALDELNTSFRVFRLDIGQTTYQFSMDDDQYVNLLIDLRNLVQSEVDKHKHQEGTIPHE